MKNKVIIGSLITTLLAFMLYSLNLRRVQNTSVEIVGQSQSVKKERGKGKLSHEPKVAEVEYPTHVQIASGSDQSWAKQIEKLMGKDQSYQVAVQDLNSGKFARVANTTKAHGVTGTGRLFLLAAVFYQEEHGKLTSHSAIKVKKSDRAKGEKALQPGIAYGTTFLRQTLMQGNKTAGNVLLRKVKPQKVNAIAKKMGADSTKFSKKYTANPLAQTTASDLVAVMDDLYKNKTLSRQYSNLTLGSLNQNATGQKPKLVQKVHGATVYAIGDDRSSVAIIENNGQAYCVAVWSNSNKKFDKLGQVVNNFFK